MLGEALILILFAQLVHFLVRDMLPIAMTAVSPFTPFPACDLTSFVACTWWWLGLNCSGGLAFPRPVFYVVKDLVCLLSLYLSVVAPVPLVFSDITPREPQPCQPLLSSSKVQPHLISNKQNSICLQKKFLLITGITDALGVGSEVAWNLITVQWLLALSHCLF